VKTYPSGRQVEHRSVRSARAGVAPQRHYDEIGLIEPERADPSTGYRSYSVHQLGRLHRIVALRDMGSTRRWRKQLLDERVLQPLLIARPAPSSVSDEEPVDLG
jgi:DNA-binding transcriptional MerR regulator